MDGHKDEAFKCLHIAMNSIQAGDNDGALKFLNKARRLDPSIQIDEFLSNLNASSEENKDKSPNEFTVESPPDPSESGPRQRALATSSSSATSPAYTEEQVTVDHGPNRLRTVIQLLVILFLSLLVNFWPTLEPVYSLSRTHYHDATFTTPKGVNYFAKSGKFGQWYPLIVVKVLRLSNELRLTTTGSYGVVAGSSGRSIISDTYVRRQFVMR